MIDTTMTLDENDRFLVVDIQDTSEGWFLHWRETKGKPKDEERYRIDLAREYTLSEIEQNAVQFDNGITSMAIPKKLVEGRIARVVPETKRRALVRALEPIQSDIDAGRLETVLILAEHNAFDGHVMFWCKDGKGYTSSVDDAWKCPWERARDITRNGTRPIPFDIAERFAVRAVKLTDGLVRELRDASVLLRARAAATAAEQQIMRIAHPQQRHADGAISSV